MTDRAALADWVERYRVAWGSNDPAAIAALFTEDAVYFTEPHHPPWRGHAEIVEGWLAHRDEPRDFAFRFSSARIWMRPASKPTIGQPLRAPRSPGYKDRLAFSCTAQERQCITPPSTAICGLKPD